jgi:hypothetical protein
MMPAKTEDIEEGQERAIGHPYCVTANFTIAETDRIIIDITELRRLAELAQSKPLLQMADALNCSGRFDPAVFDDPDFETLLDCILANEGDFGLSCTHAFDWLIETHHHAPAQHQIRDRLVQKTQEFLNSEKLRDLREKKHPVFIYYAAWIADHMPAGDNKEAAIKHRYDIIAECTQSHSKTAAQIMHRAGKSYADFLSPETIRLFAEKVRAIVAEHETIAAHQSSMRGRLTSAFGRGVNPNDLLDDEDRLEMSTWATRILEAGLSPRPEHEGPHTPEEGIS